MWDIKESGFPRRPIRSRCDCSIVIVHGTQVVLINCSADRPSKARSCYLVESEMYSAVNARVGDVVENLRERGVLKRDVGFCAIRDRDRMASLAVKTPQNLGSAATSA